MTKEEIVGTLTRIFAEVFNDSNIVLRNDMTSNDVDGWNSLTHMVLITKIEEEFGIRFKLRELNQLRQVGDLVDIIESKI